MFTKEQIENLSEFLNIAFKFSENLTLTCIFSKDNTSYIEYNTKLERFEFFLIFKDNIKFEFNTKTLDFKEIHKAMKEYNHQMYSEAIIISKLRSNVCKQLEKMI